MPVDFDTALSNLIALGRWSVENDLQRTRNEATTRLQLIDRLLFECLGWDRADCVSEERFEGEYSDYSLSAPHRLLIVEAKKEGNYFELPAGLDRISYDIRYFRKHHVEIFEAIKQGIGYCLERGAPFGAVTNGRQVIAFLGSRTDGVPPLEGRTVVFASFELMEKHFHQLWQCLSRPGVQAHHLALVLQEGTAIPPPPKLSKLVTAYPGYRNRNELQTDLQILGDLLIEDISRSVDEAEFLRNCYCQSGALSQYSIINRHILEARYSSLFEQSTGGPSLTPLVSRRGINPEAVAESISRRPIILLGDVGVGKTMFIRHFIRISAADLLQNALLFYVDFGVNPTLSTELRAFMAEEISRQLLNNYEVDSDELDFVRGVYYSDIQRFQKGIYSHLRESDPQEYRRKEVELLERKVSDRSEHLKHCLNHVSQARQQQVVVFLDNIDQRSFEFQEEVFLIGQSIAETWPVTVYIAIRPETFYRSKKKGSLTAYHAKAFTISPPRVDRVIEKRLEYGIGLLAQGQLSQLKGTAVNLTTLQDYLGILLRSFRQNTHLVEFIDNMCGGNIRLALDFIRIFVGSGHVDTVKILDLYSSFDQYIVSLHEFLRAVIYGEQEHFDPRVSEVVNLFDISASDGREHFLLLIILAQLDLWGQSSSSGGYFETSAIIEFCQDLGFQVSQTQFAIGRALSRKLIEAHTKEDEPEGEAAFYRITSVGGYYYKRLAGMFAYVDAMVVDTPVVDPIVRDELGDVRLIQDRLDRVRKFHSYLLAQWQLVARDGLAFDFQQISGRLGTEVEKISSKLAAPPRDGDFGRQRGWGNRPESDRSRGRGRLRRS